MRKLLIITTFLLVLLQNNGNVFAQQKTSSHLDTYEKVLDIVFPKDNLSGSFGYGFVLRFKPSFDAESQINIKNDLGKIEVVEYKALDGHIYDQLSQLYKRGVKHEPEELAKHIRIQKRVLKISASQIKQWREEFYQSLALASNYERKNIGENMQQSLIADDGTSYLLWYHGASDIYYEFNGGTNENSPISLSESSLVNWMKGIRANVNKIK